MKLRPLFFIFCPNKNDLWWKLLRKNEPPHYTFGIPGALESTQRNIPGFEKSKIIWKNKKQTHPFDFHHRDFHDWYFFVNKNLFQKNANTIWSNFFLNMIYKTKNYIIEKRCKFLIKLHFCHFVKKKKREQSEFREEKKTKWRRVEKKN